MYSVRRAKVTVHIDGLDIRTAGSEFNYAQNTCGAITRNGRSMTWGKQSEDLAEILEAARNDAMGRKLCKNCERAAEAQLSATVEEPEVEEIAEVAARETTTPVFFDNVAAAGWEDAEPVDPATADYAQVIAPRHRQARMWLWRREGETWKLVLDGVPRWQVQAFGAWAVSTN